MRCVSCFFSFQLDTERKSGHVALRGFILILSSFLAPFGLFVLFDLILYVPLTLFSYKGTGLPGLSQY